jgi:putative FmdB family regulatory protein
VPTYSYACTECGHRFDAVQSFTDANLTECPTCSGKLRKLFNSVGIVFKGSGFYRTDSRAGAVSANEKSDKADAKSADGAKKSEGTEKSGGSEKSGNSEKSGSDGAKKSDGAQKGETKSAPAKAASASAPANAS